MDKTLIIVRGIPGCGKTTFAKMLTDPGCICTADDYFMKNGKYQWDPTKIGAAHAACQAKCERLMKSHVETVVVANTSTTAKELKLYYDFAIAYGYKVFSIIVENRHNGVNEHNVPETSLKAMVERFDVKLI